MCKFIKLFVLALALLLLTSCFSVGGTPYKKIKKATTNAINGTEVNQTIKGRVVGTIAMVIDDKPVSGVIDAEITGKSKGELEAKFTMKPGEDVDKDESMILRLLALFQQMFILIILIVWVVTRCVGGVFRRMAKKSISIMVASSVILGYAIFSELNNFDILGIGVVAWGVATYLYDIFIKKGYRELIGIKNK